MPRPTTKTDLIQSAKKQFDKLWKLFDTMTDYEQTAAFDFDKDMNKKEAHWKRDKNIRDVLIHLYEWHQLVLDWVSANQSGEEKAFLPSPYNWKTYGDMNSEFWEKHQSTPYINSKQMLLDSHQKILDLVDQFTNEELFENKHFKWTGTTSLGSYCVSATSSHYDWAIKKIKLHIKHHLK